MDTPAEGRCNELREEFRLTKCCLHHDDPSLFVKPQCFKPKSYIYWTTFWAIYYITMLCLDIYYNEDLGGEYFIYLTNWAYLLQSTLVFMDFSVSVYVYCRRKDIHNGLESGTTWYLKILWVLFNTNNSVSILVTIIYYTLLEAEYSHGSINKHLLNSVYTLLALCFCAKPVQLLHVYQPMIFGVIYLVFSIIYHVLGYAPIYSVLDWSKTGSAAMLSCLAIFIGIPVMHLVTFAIHTLRNYIYYNCKCFKSNIDAELKVKREITTRDVVLQENGHTPQQENHTSPQENHTSSQENHTSRQESRTSQHTGHNSVAPTTEL